MRELTFIRRFLELNTAEQLFHIKRETRYNIQADSCEEAVAILSKQLDNTEGREGVLANNGFPADCTTRDGQSLYIAMHGVVASIYQQEDAGSFGSFQDRLTRTGDGEEVSVYQGFYADDQLLCPRALTVHRLQIRGDECNYLFYNEEGRYRGEYDKYLWYDKVLYKGLGFEDNEDKSVSGNV